MIGGRANGSAVFSGDAIRFLHAHKGELLDATPDQRARLLVERLYLVACFDVLYLNFVILIRVACGERSRTVFAPPAAAQLGIPRHTLPRTEGVRGRIQDAHPESSGEVPVARHRERGGGAGGGNPDVAACRAEKGRGGEERGGAGGGGELFGAARWG